MPIVDFVKGEEPSYFQGCGCLSYSTNFILFLGLRIHCVEYFTVLLYKVIVMTSCISLSGLLEYCTLISWCFCLFSTFPMYGAVFFHYTFKLSKKKKGMELKKQEYHWHSLCEHLILDLSLPVKEWKLMIKLRYASLELLR